MALTPPSSAEVKERVELYLYFPSGTSWTVLGRNFTFFPLTCVIFCSLSSILFDNGLLCHVNGNISGLSAYVVGATYHKKKMLFEYGTVILYAFNIDAF